MFVSIAIDPGGEGRAKELAELLMQYGFEKVQRGLWESTIVSPDTLNRLKRDLDCATDAFDRIRIFQFPVDGTLVLTTLRDKKWRRLVAKGGETTAPIPAAQKPAAPVNKAGTPQRPASAQRPAVPANKAGAAQRATAVQRPAQAGTAAARTKPAVRHGRRATDL